MTLQALEGKAVAIDRLGRRPTEHAAGREQARAEATREGATVKPPLSDGTESAQQRRRFFTVAQAADLLGLSQSTLFRAIRAGEFPAIKVRGRYVVPAKAIDQMELSALATGLVDSTDHTIGSVA